MKRSCRCTLRPFTALAVAVLFSGTALRADDHVLPLSELHDAISQASATREANRAAIDHFFSEPRVETTLKNAGIDVRQVQRQAALLSDEEQARLAAKVRDANRQIAGGELKDSQVTLIIMAIALFAFLAVLVLAFK